MERRNGASAPKIVETRGVSGTDENVVTPTHVFVRLGPAQRVRVPLPMSQATLEALAKVSGPKRC